MNRDALSLKAKKFLAIQSLFYALANSIEAMVPFLLAPLLTRMLDPAAYGVWVLFVTYATFMRPVVGLTTQDAIRMRFYDFDQGHLDRFTHTALFVMSALAVVTSIVCILFDQAIAQATQFPMGWLVSIVLAAFLYEVFYTALALQQFHNRRRAFLSTQAIQAGLSITFILLFLFAGWGWKGVVLGRMLSMAVATLYSLKLLGFTFPALLRMPKRSFYRDIASFGFIYWPAGAVIMVVATTDKVVAAHYLGVESSAIYGVAALFASAFWMINYSFVLAWTPWLFRKLKTGNGRSMREVVSVSSLYFLMSSLAALAFYLAALLVAPILLGEAFHGAISLLHYIMAAIVLQGYFMHNMKFLHFDKRIRLMSMLSVLTIALNVWLSIEWVEPWGLRGIMLATMVSFGVAFVISGCLVLARWMPSEKRGKAVHG
ncbi:oligosaccharide flippase family protein [Qipengyuania flava]|nr:oligosaccharide flippase family protein [Qipengyuania flava]